MSLRFVLCFAASIALPLFTVAATPNTIVPDTSRTLRRIDSIRTYEKDQVVVTGTRNDVRLKDSPVRVEVIGSERVKTTAMVNIGDLLKEQTGLMMTGAIRSGIQMNGLGADYTMILIDGQPVVGRVAGVLDLSRISVGNIERVARFQYELAGDLMQFALDQMNATVKAKDLPTLLSKQREIATKFAEKATTRQQALGIIAAQDGVLDSLKGALER